LNGDTKRTTSVVLNILLVLLSAEVLVAATEVLLTAEMLFARHKEMGEER
jgi:hypothetical protein